MWGISGLLGALQRCAPQQSTPNGLRPANLLRTSVNCDAAAPLECFGLVSCVSNTGSRWAEPPRMLDLRKTPSPSHYNPSPLFSPCPSPRTHAFPHSASTSTGREACTASAIREAGGSAHIPPLPPSRRQAWRYGAHPSPSQPWYRRAHGTAKPCVLYEDMFALHAECAVGAAPHWHSWTDNRTLYLTTMSSSSCAHKCTAVWVPVTPAWVLPGC